MSRADFLVALCALGWFAIRVTPDRALHLFTHLYGPWHPYPTWNTTKHLDGRITEQPINDWWRKCRVCGWIDRRTVYADWVRELGPDGKHKRLSDHKMRDPWSEDYGKP